MLLTACILHNNSWKYKTSVARKRYYLPSSFHTFPPYTPASAQRCSNPVNSNIKHITSKRRHAPHTWALWAARDPQAPYCASPCAHFNALPTRATSTANHILLDMITLLINLPTTWFIQSPLTPSLLGPYILLSMWDSNNASMPRQFPSLSFPIHYSPVIHVPSAATKLWPQATQRAITRTAQ